ncbi:MAG: HAMP domain-containing histidine kinase [Gemmatimonadota bacterium]|nr:HAMP domain-containing histidine kinase [Gemmatimonadota bacterium]MDH3423636.1 HAMP domain-containing histidine kinase [Gemmatimonadota bacterium]
MSRSFRVQLALRATATIALALVVISVVSVLGLASVLDRDLDATILNVATIQAASLTDGPLGEMHFHDWELTPAEAESVRDLVRYAQVWQVEGVSLLRSQYMTGDLPLELAYLDRAGAGELVWTDATFQDIPVRVLYFPLERLGELHERHVLQVAAPLSSRNALVSQVGLFLTLLSVGVIASMFAGSWWLAGRAIRPVHEVIDQAEEIGAKSLERRIQAYADTREYRRLVDVLNTMLSRIESAFEGQRQFTADASHELRSPLTAMRGELELALRRDRDAPEYRRVLGSTLEEVVRLSRITEDLLTLARSDSGVLLTRPEPVEVAGIVDRVIEKLRGPAAAKGLEVEQSMVGDTTAEVDPVLLGQVVWNLVDNAIRFTPRGGRIRVTAQGSDGHVDLAVEDSGPGFPEDRVDRVFDRFFQADPARSRSEEAPGTGLGLAIVKGVAEAHGGEVDATNLPGGGARVAVRFPRHSAVKG